MKNKYKFLEFDGAELNNYLASFLVFGGDTPSYGEVALYQHKLDLEKHEAIVAELKSKLEATEKVYRMNREYVEEAKSKIADLEQEKIKIAKDAVVLIEQLKKENTFLKEQLNGLKDHLDGIINNKNRSLE